MNKYFTIILLTVFFLVAAFSSCKKDEDEKDVPIITITFYGSGHKCIFLLGTGEASINWGDGNKNTQKLTLPEDIFDIDRFPKFDIDRFPNFWHEYSAPFSKNRTVSITGENIIGVGGWNMTDIDISCFPSLKALIYNSLEIDLSKFTEIEYLNCDYNYLLSSLDVSNNVALKYLSFTQTKLTSLDLSRNTALEYLSCNGNYQFATLDVSNNLVLKSLDCGSNPFPSLDVSKNLALKSLYCTGNQFSSLDVSKNTSLVRLICDQSQLASLHVGKNTALKILDCSKNSNITTLDLSGCSALEYINCFDINQLTSLNISGCDELYFLDCRFGRMNAAALNALFDSLPDRNGKDIGVIKVSANPGLNEAEYNKTIAINKNWNVIETLEF